MEEGPGERMSRMQETQEKVATTVASQVPRQDGRGGGLIPILKGGLKHDTPGDLVGEVARACFRDFPEVQALLDAPRHDAAPTTTGLCTHGSVIHRADFATMTRREAPAPVVAAYIRDIHSLVLVHGSWRMRPRLAIGVLLESRG